MRSKKSREPLGGGGSSFGGTLSPHKREVFSLVFWGQLVFSFYNCPLLFLFLCKCNFRAVYGYLCLCLVPQDGLRTLRHGLTGFDCGSDWIRLSGDTVGTKHTLL